MAKSPQQDDLFGLCERDQPKSRQISTQAPRQPSCPSGRDRSAGLQRNVRGRPSASTNTSDRKRKRPATGPGETVVPTALNKGHSQRSAFFYFN